MVEVLTKTMCMFSPEVSAELSTFDGVVRFACQLVSLMVLGDSVITCDLVVHSETIDEASI